MSRRTPRTLLALVLGSSLALLTAGAALANEAPHHVIIADAACNPGTAAARLISGNGIVPMYMSTTPVGCMVMVGTFNP